MDQRGWADIAEPSGMIVVPRRGRCRAAPRSSLLAAAPHHRFPVVRRHDGRMGDRLGGQRLVIADRGHEHLHRGVADVAAADKERGFVSRRLAGLPVLASEITAEPDTDHVRGRHAGVGERRRHARPGSRRCSAQATQCLTSGLAVTTAPVRFCASTVELSVPTLMIFGNAADDFLERRLFARLAVLADGKLLLIGGDDAHVVSFQPLALNEIAGLLADLGAHVEAVEADERGGLPVPLLIGSSDATSGILACAAMSITCGPIF